MILDEIQAHKLKIKEEEEFAQALRDNYARLGNGNFQQVLSSTMRELGLPIIWDKS